MVRLQSKLLKLGYGLDIEGQVFDKEQENIDDKNNPHRNPDKQDFVPQNMEQDTTVALSEQQEIAEAKDRLNPQVHDRT